jgi:hypothetical protein
VAAGRRSSRPHRTAHHLTKSEVFREWCQHTSRARGLLAAEGGSAWLTTLPVAAVRRGTTTTVARLKLRRDWLLLPFKGLPPIDVGRDR